MSYLANGQPAPDPTMYVWCRVHSEQPGHDGGRKGPVPAHYGKDEYGSRGYVCWHCAMDQWREAQAVTFGAR